MEKKTINQKMDVVYWREKTALPKSREDSMAKRMKRNKPLLKFDGSSLSKKRNKELDMLGSPKHLQKFEFEKKKSKGKVKQRMSLVFNKQFGQRSPNYNSNVEKRLFKGSSQRDFKQVKNLRPENSYNMGDFDFKKIKKLNENQAKNLIEVESEYSHLSFLKSGASSRKNSPHKQIKGKSDQI